MKIYTKTGDDGTTALIGRDRLSKSDPSIEAIGSVDELNAHIGLLRDQEVNRNRVAELLFIQDRLFALSAILAQGKVDSKLQIGEADIERLENRIDVMESELAPITKFVLPGGHSSVSHGHIARTVCRRAERRVIVLKPSDPVFTKFLNRLSDYLFVLIRMMTKELKITESYWSPQ